MNPDDKTNASFAQIVTDQLLDSMKTGERVDPDLISYAEDVIQVHQLVVQLAFVGLIVDRIPQLAVYNEALDNLIGQLDTKDLAEASIGEKIRAASVMNNSVKTTIDVINEMMSSKDAVNMLISSMKNQFGDEGAAVAKANESTLISRFQSLKPEARQQLLAGAVTLIRNKMVPEQDNMEEENNEDDG